MLRCSTTNTILVLCSKEGVTGSELHHFPDLDVAMKKQAHRYQSL